MLPNASRHSPAAVAVLVALVLAAGRPLAAQEAATPRSESGSSFSSRVYWGGGISLAFWDYTRIRVEPLIGYRITPQLSVGGKLAYEYLRYERVSGDKVTSHNYGGSVFARYRFVPQLYGHVEYGGANYERVDALGREARVGYPFLLLGGGFVQPTGRRTSLYFELLYDVLQDEDSPYDNGGPFVAVGVAVGF